MTDLSTHAESIPSPAPAIVETTPSPAVETNTAKSPSRDRSDVVTHSPELTTELHKIWAKNNPERESNGRFVAEEKPTAETAPKESTTILPDEKGTEQPETAAIDVPVSWVADKRELWTSIPRAAQEYVAKRESEATEAISRAGNERKAFEPIQQTLEQFKDVYERNNLPPQEAIARMFAVEQWLATDPQTAIRNIAQAYGVDLSKAASGEPTLQSDPTIQALKGEVSQLRSFLTAQQRQAQEADRSTLAHEIADFAKDKPHFEAVRKVMAGLMQSEAATTLQEAYDMATNADPKIRSVLQKQNQKVEQEKQAKEDAERAKKAKSAATVNAKSTLATSEQGKTMDDDLRAIAAKHYGRTRGV